MSKLEHGDLVQLLVQLSVMLAAGRMFAEAARKLRQPAVVGEILAGVLLGPTVLGSISLPTFQQLFPATGLSPVVLSGFVQVAVIMLLFVAGLEVDLQVVWQQGRRALATSLLGLIIPFLFGFIFPYFFQSLFGIAQHANPTVFALFMGTAMSISALPVIVRILMDLNLFKSKLGLLVVTSAMVDDVVGWMIFSVLLSLIGQHHEMSLWQTVGLTIAFVVAMLTVGRSLLNKLLPWVNRHLSWPGGALSLSLALCFMGAAFTERIGLHAIFGAFIMGIALGDSAHYSERAKEIVHQFITHVFAPLFFVSIGLRVNFIANFDWLLTVLILFIAFAGKMIGSGLGARLGGLGWRESLAAASGMNARGAVEIVLGLIALDNQLINETVFVSLVVMALVTSLSSGPMMKWLLKSPKR